MKDDVSKIIDGTWVILYPNEHNPLHKQPVRALYQSGYFYCEGTDPIEGPDYYLGDVLTYNYGFTYYHGIK